MNKIIPSIDKLYYSFNTTPDSNSEILNIIELAGYKIINPITQIDHNYKLHQSISYKNIHVASLHLESRYKRNLHTIKFYNKSLYTNQNIVKELIKLINAYYKDSYISKLEIALDTNINLLKRYRRLTKTNSLQLAKHYQGDYYGNEYLNNKYTRNKLNETKYILHKNNQFTNDDILGKHPFFRIENKSNLLFKTNNRNYILDYLRNKGIDTSQPIYRFELTLPSRNAFISRKYSRYCNNANELTPAQYSILPTKLKSDYLKINYINYYSIKINYLFDNSDYILSIFNIYYNKIFIKNADKLLKINNKAMNINTTAHKCNKRNSKIEIEEKENANNLIIEILKNKNNLQDKYINEINNIIKRNERELNKENNNIFSIFK